MTVLTFPKRDARVTGCPISPTPIQVRMMQGATMVLALEAAKAKAKENLKRQNRRLADVEHREIMHLAKVYLEQHPTELIANAKETVDLWFRQGRFGPRGGLRKR